MKSDRENIIHDIKTPLTSLSLYLDLLEQSAVDKNEANMYVQKAKEQVKKISKILERIS